MLSNKEKEDLEENRRKLNVLIENNAPLEEIQKQSEILDKFILLAYEKRVEL